MIFIALVILAVIFGILVIAKKIKIAPLFAGRYEVTGIDVSHYQGSIDWPVLARQDLDFAFIKATEGSGHVDECFYDNWREAEKTDLYIGAYHFFSFDSEGGKQAQFYIDTVGSLHGKLAPVIDVEFYGDKEKNPPSREEVVTQLRKMLETLEEYYQVKPIIYTTYSAYHHYIRDEFTAYPLWIRNVYYQPFLLSGNTWSFWQYTDTAVLDGYQGAEKYIDRNVFKGTREDLQKMTVQCEEEDCASFLEIPTENREAYRSREEVFAAIEKGDFSVVERKYADPETIVEELEMAYETDGDSSRMLRSDIDGDGVEELLFLIQYDFEEYERIDFIIDYRNGRAVCTYLDWCDGNEWLILAKEGKLVHCLRSSSEWCTYYGLHECVLNARGIKELDCLGNGIEVCDVHQLGESGLWWWEGQQPEITQVGIYYTRMKEENAKDGTGGSVVKELISKEAFLASFVELTGEEQVWSEIMMKIE